MNTWPFKFRQLAATFAEVITNQTTNCNTMVITVQELKAMKDAGQDFVLIDVREPHEYAEFNLGGELLPLGTIPDHVDKIAGYAGRPIVVHCRSGMRSARAQEFLMAQGISNISNLQGGVLAWMENYGNQGL